MLTLMIRAPFVASDEEMIIAREAHARLKPIAEAGLNVRVRVIEQAEVIIPLPARVVRLISDVLDLMAEGRAVSLIPHDAELTTQQAADLLNVSRPHVVSLIEAGALAHRKVGTHRRVLARNVLAHKAATAAAGARALDRLSEVSQDLGLDD